MGQPLVSVSFKDGWFWAAQRQKRPAACPAACPADKNSLKVSQQAWSPTDWGVGFRLRWCLHLVGFQVGKHADKAGLLGCRLCSLISSLLRCGSPPSTRDLPRRNRFLLFLLHPPLPFKKKLQLVCDTAWRGWRSNLHLRGEKQKKQVDAHS